MKSLIRYLFWKYCGEFSILGRVNGKAFLLNIKNNSIQRSYLQAMGSYENVKAIPGEMKKEEFEKLVDLFERNIL